MIYGHPMRQLIGDIQEKIGLEGGGEGVRETSLSSSGDHGSLLVIRNKNCGGIKLMTFTCQTFIIMSENTVKAVLFFVDSCLLDELWLTVWFPSQIPTTLQTDFTLQIPTT